LEGSLRHSRTSLLQSQFI